MDTVSKKLQINQNIVYKYSYGDEDVLGTKIMLQELERNHFKLSIDQDTFEFYRKVKFFGLSFEIIKEETKSKIEVGGLNTITTTIEFKYTSPINHDGRYYDWFVLETFD